MSPRTMAAPTRDSRPHELLLSALASCTAITMRMYADRKQWAVSSIGVTVSMERTQNGAQIDTKIHMEIDLPADLPLEQRERMAADSRARARCTVPWRARSS